MEDKPAVEFAQKKDEEEYSPGWWALGGVALVSGGMAIVTALPGMWESQVVGNTSRRAGLARIFEAIGFVPTVSIFSAIAIAAAVGAVISFIKWQRNEGKE
jgi:hypothetical protein